MGHVEVVKVVAAVVGLVETVVAGNVVVVLVVVAIDLDHEQRKKRVPKGTYGMTWKRKVVGVVDAVVGDEEEVENGSPGSMEVVRGWDRYA